MSASIIEIFRAGPPAPKVALLPDSFFFVRSVPVEAGADAAQVAQLAELSLESFSPFPVAQLFWGHFWPQGGGTALVFACYRRRFSQDQIDSWASAEWVAPSFCSVLGLPFEGPATVIYPGAETVTAVHWSRPGAPDAVHTVPLPPEGGEPAFTAARDTLLRRIGEVGAVTDFPAVPLAASTSDEDTYAFIAGSRKLVLPTEQAAPLDVRPKDELERLKRARFRNLLYWRFGVGLVAALGLLALGEASVAGGGLYQKTRKAQVNQQRPVVEKIMSEQALASRINELSAQRLLPFEMITVLAEKKPRSVQFMRAATTGLYTIRVEAQTNSAEDLAAWQNALNAAPSLQSVDLKVNDSRDGLTRFTLEAVFRSGGLAPGQQT